MEKKQKNKWLSFLADGMLSGLMIGIGCVVSMSCENRYLGAFLFSLGLFCIVQFQYGLYTGKVGYIFDRDKAYLGETFFTFLANAIGAGLTAGIVHLTRFATETKVNGMDVTLMDRAQTTMSAKLDDSLLSSFVLAFFCGILMFSAVEGSRRCNEKKNFIGGVFNTVHRAYDKGAHTYENGAWGAALGILNAGLSIAGGLSAIYTLGSSSIGLEVKSAGSKDLNKAYWVKGNGSI